MSRTLSWEEFLCCLNSFMTLSDELDDGWTWKGDKDIPGGAYIVKKDLKPSFECYSTPEELLQDFEDNTLQSDEQDAGEAKYSRTDLDLSTWEYHVLYSPSYATPVLYFNAWTPAGQLFPLESIWHGMVRGLHQAVELQQWEALTQQEHPLLRKPFFQLHPCKTAELLGNHNHDIANPVVTWLSSVGPYVGLSLNPKYATLVSK